MDITVLFYIALGIGIAGVAYMVWWVNSMNRWLDQQRSMKDERG